jgi:hypothetical protein
MSDQRAFVHDMMNYLGIIVGYSNLLLDDLAPEDPRRVDLDEIRKAGEAAIALMDRLGGPASGDGQK